MFLIKICGPKLSVCCMVISIWGIIQLTLMGVFFYVNAAAFAEDILVNQTLLHENTEQFFKNINKAYGRNAVTCWITTAMYGVTFGISLCQFFTNKKRLQRRAHSK